MKKLGGVLFALVALALVIAAVVLVVKLVKGALNTILGRQARTEIGPCGSSSAVRFSKAARRF